MKLGRGRVVTFVWVVLGCGRTGLLLPDLDASTGSGGEGGSLADLRDYCDVDADCPQDDPCAVSYCSAPTHPRTRRTCQARPVDCNDGDTCTVDRCDATARGCVHERPADEDHDGFVGKAPDGVPASCGGADCDDRDPRVFPGAREICDGKDNDCNGGIDEGASYAALGSPVLVAPTFEHSQVGDVVFDGASFGLTYTYRDASDHTTSYFERLDGSGSIIAGPVRVSEINADTFAGSIAWSGRSYLTAWSDDRQASNYEVYATRFDQQAQKLQPDLRLTTADDFSFHATVSYTGSEYVTVWADHRFVRGGGGSAVFGRRLSESGAAVADEVRLTSSDEDADFGALAAGKTRLGVPYVVSGAELPDGSEPPTAIRFRTFDLTLGDGTPPVELGADGQDPNVTAVGDYFVAAWHTGNLKRGFGSSIVAAVFDERGNVLTGGVITSGDTHAKHRSLLSLGDRVFVAWEATPPDSDVFELFYEVLSVPSLAVVTPRQLLLKSAAGWPLLEPHALLEASGDVAITYNENGTYLGYFMRLGCAMGP